MTQEQERNLINLRRSKILELLSKGYTNQAEIARTLNISEPTVSRDVSFLKEQAQEELRTHIQERIPFEYQRSRQAINDLIRRANEILDNTKDDPKTQLQVINTLANLWAGNMSLTTDGSTIEQAYKRVQTLEEIQKRSSEEAVFSDKEVKEYYQQEGESAPNEEPEEDLEEHD